MCYLTVFLIVLPCFLSQPLSDLHSVSPHQFTCYCYSFQILPFSCLSADLSAGFRRREDYRTNKNVTRQTICSQKALPSMFAMKYCKQKTKQNKHTQNTNALYAHRMAVVVGREVSAMFWCSEHPVPLSPVILLFIFVANCPLICLPTARAGGLSHALHQSPMMSKC